MKQLHLVFSGSVQGVGFRFTAENHARSYGIKGWVKNLSDDRVELVAQGKDENVDLFVEALKKEFTVTSSLSSEEPIQVFSRFEIRF